MSDAIYRRLQEYLDSLPVGFPKAGSGIEITILKRLFDPQEAEMAVLAAKTPETADTFAIGRVLNLR